MKISLFIMSIALFSLFFSCKKETQEYPNPTERLLKRKLYFNHIDDKIPYTTIKYEYDLDNKLIREVTDSYRIDSMEYNLGSVLVKKLEFEKNNLGVFILVDSTCYNYTDGLLVNEVSIDPWYSSVRFKYRYEYINTKLVRKYEFYYQNFVSLTSYEYSGDYCTKETRYTDSIGSTISTYQIHYYKNKRLSGTELFGFNGSKLQIISYSYDGSGNLVTEEAKHPNPNAAKPYYYVIRYEY